jgi:hypothetical protein
MVLDGVPDSELTREQIIARNLSVVQAHFHNENPEMVDKAIALYADDIIWEAPLRGIVLTDPAEIRASYMAIFRTIKFNKITAIRRFATEEYVFDDTLADVEVVGDEMPNLGFPVGSRISGRLTHVFHMKDGKIRREIAYEGLREWGGPRDRDSIPDGSPTVIFDPTKFED